MFSTKAGATRLMIGVVVALIAIKVLVGWLSGSISLLAQASDSLLDLFAALITFSAVRFASRPADAEHPYGHGKVEDLAGVGQCILIFVAAGLIIYSSIGRIVRGTTVELVESGMAVMLFSIVISIFLSRHLLKVSRDTNSVALEANARNIAADVYSALAVLVGLMVVRFTGFDIVDPILAMGVALYIVKVAVDTIRKPISGLLDEKLSPSELSAIEHSLGKQRREVAGFHALRTRRSGSQSYIDLHLVMSKDVNLEQAHRICDQVEDEIRSALPQASVTIHVEPCDEKCEQCSVICSKRRKRPRRSASCDLSGE